MHIKAFIFPYLTNDQITLLILKQLHKHIRLYLVWQKHDKSTLLELAINRESYKKLKHHMQAKITHIQTRTTYMQARIVHMHIKTRRQKKKKVETNLVFFLQKMIK